MRPYPYLTANRRPTEFSPTFEIGRNFAWHKPHNLRDRLNEAFTSLAAKRPDTTHAAGAAAAATADSTAVKRDSAATPASHAKGRFTLQVAAYSSRVDADRSVARLKQRGIDARVETAGKYFRVRIGRYETRAAALAAQRELKAKKIETRLTDTSGDSK